MVLLGRANVALSYREVNSNSKLLNNLTSLC